jgi:hypothetical protein
MSRFMEMRRHGLLAVPRTEGEPSNLASRRANPAAWAQTVLAVSELGRIAAKRSNGASNGPEPSASQQAIAP